MTRIVFLDRGTISPSLDLSRPKAPCDFETHDQTSEAEVVARLKGAEIAITNKVPLRRAALEQLPDLKFITVAATGYDVIDMDACRDLGITVSNVRGYATATVPEHTMALILALRRALPGYRQDVLAGEWQRSGQFCFFTHPINDLAGSKIGIVGSGSIGQAVGKLAQAFGMEVMFAGRKGEVSPGGNRVPFEKVLATADVLTLHAPLTPDTRDLIGLDEFRRMTRHPVVINTGRGGLVNEADAVTAIEEELIAGLGFDVLTTEPPQADNPILRIASRPNVILTPHTAWASAEAMKSLWTQVVESIDAFLGGKPIRTL